jgi:hypothetical protein
MMFWKSLISSFLRYQVKCSSGKVITFFFFHWFCLEFHLTMMYLQSSMLFLSNRAFIKNSKMESGLLQVYEGISKQLSMFCSNYIQESQCLNLEVSKIAHSFLPHFGLFLNQTYLLISIVRWVKILSCTSCLNDNARIGGTWLLCIYFYLLL